MKKSKKEDIAKIKDRYRKQSDAEILKLKKYFNENEKSFIVKGMEWIATNEYKSLSCCRCVSFVLEPRVLKFKDLRHRFEIN